MGTFIVSAILIAWVAAVIAYWVRRKKAGKSISCDCGSKSEGSCPACSAAQSMVDHMQQDVGATKPHVENG